MAYSPKSLVEVIQHNKTKKLAIGKIIESNPQALPVIPKLVTDNRTTQRQTDVDKLQLNRGILENIHAQIQTNRQNNRNIMKLFPDIEMSVQILVSSILSPKKMTDIKLNYRIGKKLPVGPGISALLLEDVREYVTEVYEIEDKLPEIVREALFTSGSYCMAVIPESGVDEVINSDLIASFSTESFQTKADSILSTLTDCINMRPGNACAGDLPSSATAEDFVKHITSDRFVRMTDNPGVIRLADLKDNVSRQFMMRSYRKGVSVAAESADKIQYLDIFRKRNVSISPTNVKTINRRDDTRRRSIGTPMVVRITSGIPVSVPGNESEHAGYLLLLGENGKPLDTESAFDSSNINAANPSFGTMTTGGGMTPVQVAYRNLVGDNSAKVNASQLFDMYRDVIENQLYTSIQSTLMGKTVKIANRNDIFFLMFCRALAGEKTSMLFIPKELMAYFAFYYDENGVGKSILDNLSILCSLRAILLFARVMAQAKNAIDVTKVNISLSPEDVDPEKTIQTVQDGVLKLRQNFFPLGINNPVDLINWIQRAGLQFAYSNNPLVPEVDISFESAAIQHEAPDGDLEESLRKQTFQALGLPPETVDNAFSPEFATNVVNNNILLSKRVMVYQKALCKTLSQLVGMFIYNDEDLRDKLRETIANNANEFQAGLSQPHKEMYAKNAAEFIEFFLDNLSDNISIELPKPENTNLTNLAAEFDVYKTGLEAVIDSVISTDIFTEDITGVLASHIDTVRNVYKHHLIRQWCADNNYYPEVLAVTNTSKEDVDALTSAIVAHLTGTMSNSVNILTLMQKFKNAASKDLESVNGESAEASAGSSASADTGGGGKNEDGGSDGDGSADTDLDISLNF